METKNRGNNPEHLVNASTAGPDEIREILFGMGIIKHPFIIIMDEPTNQLDLNYVMLLEKHSNSLTAH
ncbi:MAG: hypothetical protein JXR95_11425 [Deltaproteobacteria bacterium]|nr:hypothetical protein [Deltaproteobacteria bacterium]